MTVLTGPASSVSDVCIERFIHASLASVILRESSARLRLQQCKQVAHMPVVFDFLLLNRRECPFARSLRQEVHATYVVIAKIKAKNIARGFWDKAAAICFNESRQDCGFCSRGSRIGSYYIHLCPVYREHKTDHALSD